MRDKAFYIQSIKMDLYRIITATGDIQKEVALESVQEFFHHALNDFNKIELSDNERVLRDSVNHLMHAIKQNIQDPYKRLRWVEEVMTVRCRL
ncbi:hypothetical protein COU89_01345 [Candidatus Roizmanbacteria bacterium CG10_big_fil_rev_8_21_14_0_10_45_7]|uniref:Uncharacterized protein n=1 Tax=Candidatus Roizmanbacteria bacterium CG10_big_fil_rev_8_21_14_0_10_45_7 TaxID=1974854 RepID=A0A2M8KV64_9BACT|nr:MAG: hypothetical protein COU89_01345 [Candidatus Roizmanbacteria bacterium CG10_big_fil_rev_8_21_14_0_10_45_7]